VTAYELLTFELPWPTADPTGQGALAHDTEPPVPIEKLRPDLNPTVARAVMRCLAANRDDRPDSLDMFLQLIRKVESETD
jgi:serine/threonine-protein kinase